MVRDARILTTQQTSFPASSRRYTTSVLVSQSRHLRIVYAHFSPNIFINDRTPRMYEQIEENLERGRHALASVTTIEGAGHYVSGSISLRCYNILTTALACTSDSCPDAGRAGQRDCSYTSDSGLRGAGIQIVSHCKKELYVCHSRLPM